VLTVTHEASKAIRTLTDQTPEPESAGLRISVEPGDEGTPQLALSLTGGPYPEDQVVDAEGAHVFVSESVAPLMEDKTLDATVQDEGVAFTIHGSEDVPPS
jgi:Fe-S cluster assembly iron-binding protein IscA